MATMTSLVLLNKALVLTGASTITDITQDVPNARALNAVYAESRQGFHTECKWSFSITRTTLATVATTTFAWLHPEEGYAYTRPSGALRVWEMSDIEAIWREEGEYIISDTSGLGALWTYDNTEVGLWRPKAVTAFIDKLCSDICFIILESASKAESFLTKYQKISLPDAMSENSQTGFQQEPIDDFWLKSKTSSGGNPSRSYS